MAIRTATYPYTPLCGSSHGDPVIECHGAPAGEAEEQLLGYVALTGAYVDDVSVHPTAHGLGVAKALLCGAAAVLHAAGEPEISLDVRARNEPALALYAALGFTAGEWHRGFYDWQGGYSLEAQTARLRERIPAGVSWAK